jgi:hypothetical protein
LRTYIVGVAVSDEHNTVKWNAEQVFGSWKVLSLYFNGSPSLLRCFAPKATALR